MNIQILLKHFKSLSAKYFPIRLFIEHLVGNILHMAQILKFSEKNPT